ncbi:MAG: PAS domain S-box protein [Desulfobacterales bacterium]|nr:MAG: PAS domain S-box protein [Desulfobacterales bacterium]
MNLKQKEKKLQRQNLLLSAICSINQLLIREKDRTKLLQGVCNHLVENRGYYNAWIILLDESARPTLTVEAGLDKEFQLLKECLVRGELPDCVRTAIRRAETVVTKDPFSDCKNCPLTQTYHGRAGMSVRLAHNNKRFGTLTVSLPKELINDDQEPCLLEEVAEDIGFALNSIELEAQKKKTESDLISTIEELTERTKELNCLYSISRLIERRSYGSEEILQRVVELLPSAWKYPEIACARILLNDQEFKTANFAATEWHQSCELLVAGKNCGKLQVCYLAQRPDVDEGPFLKEERNLMNAIAERVGKMVERRKTEAALQESEKRFRDLVENSLTGISIAQENRVIYQNQEQERLLGPLPRTSILGDFKNIHPEDVTKVKRLSQDISSGKIRKLDVNFRLFTVSMANGQRTMMWIYCRAMLIDYRGQESILVNMMDMTKTKELEQLLIIQDKMASLGRVAAGIAHEIRNPLSGINIYLNTLGKIYKIEENHAKVELILDHLKSASGKIESVIRRVMDFSKPGEPKFSLIDINRPITEAINLTAVTLRKSGIKIEKNLAQNLPECRADPNLIEEMVLNLINNAAEAMKTVESEKKIVVTTAVIHGAILVKVSDSGPGVPDLIKDKIFDPFFTTKNDSTGIGLSLCHRIVSDHGGVLAASDGELGGAEFRIEIPIKD